VACALTAAECFHKYVVAALPVAERANGWWSMRCPTGHHGQPLRLHAGSVVHITYADLGKCPESEIHKWLTGQGVPAGCLARPKDLPAERRPQFGTEDGKLADAILDEAFGEGTATERLIRIAVLALGGEMPEGPMCEVLAANLGVRPRIIYKATEELRRRSRDWLGVPPAGVVPPPGGRGGNTVLPDAVPELSNRQVRWDVRLHVGAKPAAGLHVRAKPHSGQSGYPQVTDQCPIARTCKAT
jgi:hypothetical protein